MGRRSAHRSFATEKSAGWGVRTAVRQIRAYRPARERTVDALYTDRIEKPPPNPGWTPVRYPTLSDASLSPARGQATSGRVLKRPVFSPVPVLRAAGNVAVWLVVWTLDLWMAFILGCAGIALLWNLHGGLQDPSWLVCAALCWFVSSLLVGRIGDPRRRRPRRRGDVAGRTTSGSEHVP